MYSTFHISSGLFWFLSNVSDSNHNFLRCHASPVRTAWRDIDGRISSRKYAVDRPIFVGTSLPYTPLAHGLYQRLI